MNRVLVIDEKGVRIPPGRYDRIVVKPGAEVLPSEPGELPIECGEFIVLASTKKNPTIIGRAGYVAMKADKVTFNLPTPKRRKCR